MKTAQRMRFRVLPCALLPAAANLFSATPGGAGVLETSENRETDLLRTQLAAQQQQIDELRSMLEDQRKLVEAVLRLGTGAPQPAPQVQAVSAPPQIGAKSQGDEPKPSPLSFRVGTVDVTPVGFMDFTAVVRDANLGSGISTNFGAVPFSDSVNGNLR